MEDSLAVRLRRVRLERGLSLSKLARQSGIGKGTVSELENGLRGARLNTLFALSTALEVPLGALIPDRADEAPSAVSGASVTAIPLGTWASDTGTIEAYRATISPQRQRSSAHHPGVEETITVIRGRVHAGVEGDERELSTGQSIRYPGDVPHTFSAVDDDGAEMILLMHYPQPSSQRGAHMTIEQPLPERSQVVQQHLDEAGLPGRVRELPDSTRTAADAASALGCAVGAIASSLLFLADDQPVLVMTSGRHRVDTDHLARQLGAASVTMAPAKLVREITGQAIGGVSPVGHPARVRTVVDEALEDFEVIWAAGGTPRTVFPLTFADLVAITDGAPIRVAED